MQKTPWPWHDRSGRFSWLKTAVLVLECMFPAVWIAFALLTHRFGARPITEAIHQTGLWAVRFLLLSLMVSPARAIFNWHRLVLVRRQLGLTALFYGLGPPRALQLGRELEDGHRGHGDPRTGFTWKSVSWRWWAWRCWASPPATRALRHAGAWMEAAAPDRLRTWRCLATLHFFLQSKADVAEATLMAGICTSG